MFKIIDVSFPCDKYATAMRQAGVETVIRYYSRDSKPSAGKRLHRSEALALTAAGFRLCIVFEAAHGDQISYFNFDVGQKDAVYARIYAHHTIEQPEGTTIYFGVDVDADTRKSKDEINKNVIPYFRGIVQAFSEPSADRYYVIGCYGSGAVCQALLDAGLVQKTWLANPAGWTDRQKFLDSGKWDMLQHPQATIAGVDCDPDTGGPGKDIGDFVLPLPPKSVEEIDAVKYVNARSGLRLRAGPGTDFEIRSVLPYGTAVHVIGSTGSWTSIDLQGDAAIDGYVSSGFLSDTSQRFDVARPSSSGQFNASRFVGVSSDSSDDAAHIQTLIEHGNTEIGIAAARVEAKAAVHDYPTNACAAHLSALLRQSGIDVPMTIGAGKLATTIEKRGWKRIIVGKQQPGDVGVAFSIDPTPPGPDHIYLVIVAVDDDKMLIADNQNAANAAHERSARGRDGKTPTDYFLRA
ncbi:glycoside hydrolase domain-containing protein [Variovorax sp. M-6]|uniref:glycoside hydrolase domain-containing protein n=1 Tax=Variovorax sp. M-6 TaxID=3233041 RepID=UPI003F9CA27D